MKRKNETEDNIKTAILKDGDYIAKWKQERVDKLNAKISYLDQNQKVVLSYSIECPQ